jgi:hypothetical protein
MSSQALANDLFRYCDLDPGHEPAPVATYGREPATFHPSPRDRTLGRAHAPANEVHEEFTI